MAAQAIGVIGSNHTTNEENYLLQKFAREVLQTNNIDHHRTADFPAFAAALTRQARGDRDHARGLRRAGDPGDRQRSDRAASAAGLADSHQRAPASLAALPDQFAGNQAGPAGGGIHAGRTGQRRQSRSVPRRRRCGSRRARERQDNREAWIALRDKLRGEQNLVIIFGSEIRGNDVAALVTFGSAIPGAKFMCLADYANSRGAADMGLYPDLLPGYHRRRRYGATSTTSGAAFPPRRG